jgi:hypothetical protein
LLLLLLHLAADQPAGDAADDRTDYRAAIIAADHMAKHPAADCAGTGADRRAIVLAILRATRQQHCKQHHGQVSCFHILVPFVIDIAPANYEPDVAVSFIRRNELQFYTENIRLLPSIETSAVAIISLRELRSD